ncbi:hypothetical protein BpHYR1_017794 [Brachionus plicatilis]|uniref:Uncharacterized protein n=1 Tax=Brachionus plicatilis TaxID=10195 RepID=A0A3M7QU85_BRAPC|nr:hypothetical protein BpHYR1_017794 [Brachionus plicatilis]
MRASNILIHHYLLENLSFKNKIHQKKAKKHSVEHIFFSKQLLYIICFSFVKFSTKEQSKFKINSVNA